MTGAGDISHMLAVRIDLLVHDLLPGGRREGADWRAGSVAGEAGASLAVRLTAERRGLWRDWATGEGGDALDLVKAALSLGTVEALAWSHRWLGIDDRHALVTSRPASPRIAEPEADPTRWRRPWEAACPLADTTAHLYLAGRELSFGDAVGRVLRFSARRARRHPETGLLEHQPALLALLSDIRTGESCGVINAFLRADGNDRLRDKKGKTTTGRAKSAAVMLSPYDDVTMGLVLCEGCETGIALLMADLAPVWCCGGASNLARFPVLGGIEALTIAADADEAGQRAANTLAERWHAAGREVVIIAPPAGDWADEEEVAP